MLDELHTASNLLHTALERYMNACSALRNGSSYNNNIHSAVEISNTVAAQVDLIESYKNKLIVAEVAVKRARNNLANVPINALPPETLAHIFHLLLAQQPCPLRTTTHWSSDNPIALDSHELWSHIDIALSCPLSNMFHNRAETYVARAHQVPLDIHFIDPGYIRQTERSIALNNSSAHEYSAFDDESNDWADWINLDYDNNPEEFTFLSSSPQPLIRSLGLLVHHQYHPIHSRALGHCLVNCLPKGVSELVINVPNDASSSPSFFQPSPGWQDQEFVSCDQLSLTEQQLGKVWYPIKTLVLNGRYPHWASTAYHGLTELHLLGEKAFLFWNSLTS
ncbi:hypothetical protein B0J17DRAFT_764311 [Rhizoctonia solani]|nr:hypothetical protein B0J17DRAFT_764311 [Rhizoctonia solani]